MLSNPLFVEALGERGISFDGDSVPALNYKGLCEGEHKGIKASDFEEVAIVDIVKISHLAVFIVFHALVVYEDFLLTSGWSQGKEEDDDSEQEALLL